MKLKMPPLLTVLASAIGAVACITLMRDTAYNGWDFNVYWSAAQKVLHGETPYLLRDEGLWPFKYPPWTLPLFLPFGFLSKTAAHWAWGVVQALSALFVFQWTLKKTPRAGAVWFAGLGFWWITAYHALSGQIPLVLLALCLWAFDWRRKSSGENPLSLTLITWALSFRIFSVFSLLGLKVQTFFRPKVMASILVFFTLATLPALWVCGEALPGQWLLSTKDTDPSFLKNYVNGPKNQSLVALLHRLLENVASVPPSLFLDLILWLILAAVVGFWWWKKSRPLPDHESWAGWLALGVVIHPIAWFHSFVMAFPLAALALGKALQRGWKTKETLFAVLGILLTGILTRTLLGHWGLFLELASVKAWGVLLSAHVLAVPLQGKGLRQK